MALGDPYASTDELIAYLGITQDINDSLELAVLAASRWIEGYCHRQFNLATAATDRVFDVGRTGVLWVDDIGDPAITVATDSALDGSYATSWAGTDYETGPLNAIASGRPITSLGAVGSYTFPAPCHRTGLVRVGAKWGWPAVPSAVKQACLIQAARTYKRRESAEGVLGFSEFGPVRVGVRVDPDVEALLADYRLLTLA